MNHNNEPPNGRPYEFNIGLGRERLEEVESRLRGAQPIRPRLDLETIIQRASAASAPSNPPSRLGKLGGRRHVYRAMALSWTCGAVAGAILMFLYMGQSLRTVPSGRPPQLSDSPSHGATTDQDGVRGNVWTAPEGDSFADSSDPSFQPLDTDERVAPLLRDASVDYPGATLWAGAHMRGLTKVLLSDAERIDVATTRFQTGSPLSDIGGPPRKEYTVEPAQSTTSRELMRRLLQDGSRGAL